MAVSTSDPVDVGESEPAPRPRRALLGIARAEYEKLQAQLDVAQERDRAREARLDAVLEEAGVFVARLDEAVTPLADLAGSVTMRGEQDLILALRAMLARRASSVEALRVADLPIALREQTAGASSGMATRARETKGTTAEPALDVTVAWVGERAVVVHYGDGVHADGQFLETVERLSHAAAASLEARDFARRKGRRLAISLLGDERSATLFTALRDAQGVSIEQLVLRISPEAYESFTGMFGEPAWDAALFDLAVAVDRAARELGGEAFEIEGGLLCAVPAHAASAMRDAVTAIVTERDVDVDMAEA